MSRLVVEGNAVYEIDEECEKERQKRKGYRGRVGKRGKNTACEGGTPKGQ